jgi:hypothetical protein
MGSDRTFWFILVGLGVVTIGAIAISRSGDDDDDDSSDDDSDDDDDDNDDD